MAGTSRASRGPAPTEPSKVLYLLGTLSDDETIQAVRTLLASGVSQREIGRRLNISKGFLWRALRGKRPHVRAETASVEPRPLIIDPSDAAKLAERVSALEAGLREVRESVAHTSTVEGSRRKASKSGAGASPRIVEAPEP
jgi:predicted DNA-binding protein (UPF0251 family)